MFSKIFKGALIAMAGAVLTYLGQQVQAIHVQPSYVPAETAGWAIIINAIRHAIGQAKP